MRATLWGDSMSKARQENLNPARYKKMADEIPGPESSSHIANNKDATRVRRSTNGTPRWVYAFAIVAIALLLLFLAMHLTGEHGPGRHVPSSEAEG